MRKLCFGEGWLRKIYEVATFWRRSCYWRVL